MTALSTLAPAQEAPLDLGAVHAAHAEFVWRSLQRLGARESDLEDLLQEVFVVVHRRLGSFRGDAKMTTWLFAICLRVVSNHRRRGARRRETPMEGVGETTATGASPEEQLATKELLGEAEALLERMDLGKRAVFVMHEVKDMPCDAIAVALGVPVGTVHSRLHAARKVFSQASRGADARLLAVVPRPIALPSLVRAGSLARLKSLTVGHVTIVTGAALKAVVAIVLVAGAAVATAVAVGGRASSDGAAARAMASEAPSSVVETAATVADPPPSATAPSVVALASAAPKAHETLAPRPAAASATARPAPLPSSSADPLADESTRLGEANALVARDPAKALASIDAYEVAHPNGQMRDEAEYIAVQALLALGRKPAARARTDALVARSPKSVFARLAEEKMHAAD